MKCDTCGKESPFVSRVVIERDYNRANSKPLYNCPECFEKKNRERIQSQKSPVSQPSKAAS
jgi:hypothetical protein